ncbi:ABC transporter permease [Streptomyces cellulosae]|uniref:ABC transporter permease n=1 Tax=Streptomyces cellulosae TaxID=1968 RepID=UPI00225397C1|nr:ABC transporter permease [Streptomyces cellulosae]WTB83899.1 ABC transporter permease [Streptomyces cellulosae]WTB90743.1 ABC transporter permease [Streptomyces cellulosae]WTC58095.1 ABC transporter permease [Streptomyces cellulosae]
MTERPSGRPRTAASRVTVPWVRTRLRTAPGAAAALALLVAVTAFLAASLPPALDRYDEQGMRRALADAGPARTGVQIQTSDADMFLSDGPWEDLLSRERVEGPFTKLLALPGRALPLDRDQSSAGVRTTRPQKAPDRYLSQPDGVAPVFHLVAQGGVDGHSRLTQGRLPKAPQGAGAAALEAAVTTETAAKLNIRVGSVVHFPRAEGDPLAVRVTGLVAPREPDGPYWSTIPELGRPHRMVTQGPVPSQYWAGALLLAPDAGPALLDTPGAPARYWNLAPDLAALQGRDVEDVTSAVASLEGGPLLERVVAAVSPNLDVSTDLDDVLGGYAGLWSAIGPLVAVAAFGTGTVAAVVLCMAGGLAAERRRAELTLLRARGASLRGLAGRLLAETAVVAVPAAALGLLAARLTVGTGRTVQSVAAAGAVALVAALALPLRAVAVHRAVGVHTGREDVVRARPTKRRLVAELTLLAVAMGAVLTLRTRGTSAEGDPTGDELVSLAPVLVAVIAALVLVRLYPLPLRGLARPARRMRGVVGPLSLARAGRAGGSTVLPLLALLTALTTAAFGGSVLTGVTDARERAAVFAVGADARVDNLGERAAADVEERVRRVPGVEDVTPVKVSYTALAASLRVSLAGVEPDAYAALSGRLDAGAFDADLLKADGEDAVPALGSPEMEERLGDAPFPVILDDGDSFTARIVAVRTWTPALGADDFLVVDGSALRAGLEPPTGLLVTGDHADAAALKMAAGGDAQVRLRSDVVAATVESPLQTGAERVYAAAVAAGAGYAALALLLTLLRAAPERAALLARLRTMGLTRAQGRRLLVLESLPQALLAAVGGALTAWAAIRLLAPGIDLTTVAVASGAPAAGRALLRADQLSLLVPALAVVALTVGVAAVQAWWSGRRGAVRELRAGDAR